nr:hypothetical protein [Tanacetum cinerariifolium]
MLLETNHLVLLGEIGILLLRPQQGGSVAFGVSNGRISGKGKIKTGKLDFKDVYYVEELKHYNLFSVSQMCDKKNKVLFTDSDYLMLSPDFKLPDENQKGKQHKASCKAKTVSIVIQPLKVLNIDLFRPTSVMCINHKTYCLVITDGFNKFSWVYFLKSIDETTEILKDFIRKAENQFNHKVKTIRSDNETKFKNKELIEFYGLKGIKREYSNARTLQQNGVAERKNRTLIEAAKTMVLVTKPQNKIPYELLTGKQLIISYLRPFECHVTILNTIDQLGKFDGKSDLGFLVGYSLNSKALRATLQGSAGLPGAKTGEGETTIDKGLRLSISLKRPRQPSRESKIEQEQGGVRIQCCSPPPTQVYSPPKKDLSWTGLHEFADDTVTDYSRPSSAIESTSDDVRNKNSFVTETEASPSTISSKPFIKFEKATDSPTENKADKVETVRKTTIKYAELYRKTSKKSNARGNQRNWNNLKS